VTKTEAPAISPARASTSATDIRAAAPGETMMALFPVAASRKMKAAPV
jgi:hypothetical protein